jgi:hypothetical protein
MSLAEALAKCQFAHAHQCVAREVMGKLTALPYNMPRLRYCFGVVRNMDCFEFCVNYETRRAANETVMSSSEVEKVNPIWNIQPAFLPELFSPRTSPEKSGRVGAKVRTPA